MKKWHFKSENEERYSFRAYLLGHIKGNKYELKISTKSYDGAGIPISSEVLIIDDIEKYLTDNGFQPCCWSVDINWNREGVAV